MPLNVMSVVACIALLMPLIVNAVHPSDQPAQRIGVDAAEATSDVRGGKKHKHPYTSPTNIFIQVILR